MSDRFAELPTRIGRTRAQSGFAFRLDRALSLVILITILFPYVRVLPLESDVQPNFLIAITLFSPFTLTIRRGEILLLMAILVMLLLSIPPELSPQVVRAWASYLTPPLVLIFTRSYLADPSNWSRLETVMRRSLYLWVGFGALQYLTQSPILQLTLRASTTTDRGWMAFAGEPSAYGAVLFLFAAFFAARRNLRLALLALIATLIIAQSAVAVVYFAILGLAYLAVRPKLFLIWVLPLVLLLQLLTFTFDVRDLVEHLPSERRVTKLAQMLLDRSLFTDDASIASRMGDLQLAYDALFEGDFFGNGFGEIGRLKSGWGAYVYELGWIGFALVVGWIGYFLESARRVDRNTLASTAAIIIMLFSSTPLAMPMASFVIMALVLAPRPETGQAPRLDRRHARRRAEIRP